MLLVTFVGLLASISAQVKNFCNGKVNGNYPLPDIFTYLSCTRGKYKINNCTERAIFDPTLKMCKDIYTITTTNFCLQRSDGKYMNPWNCQRYLHCFNSTTTDYPCLIDEFVFNPELDVCVLPDKYPCKIIKNIVKHNVNQENPCSGKPDGSYLIPNVFMYLVCVRGESFYSGCQAGYYTYIYDPIYKACRDLMTYTLTTFCIGKPNNEYCNPWDCHSSIICSNNTSQINPCYDSALVYDPFNNGCVSPFQYGCRTYNSPCEGKEDGNYLISDVFAYLQCLSEQGSYVNCPDNHFFDQKYCNCVEATDYNFENFCIAKETGHQYRNPWDCHSSFLCVDRELFQLDCQSQHIFDPYIGSCEYNTIFQCRTLNTSNIPESMCLGKPDGNYIIPDVFAYNYCYLERALHRECFYENQIFDPIYSNCRDHGLFNLTNFCVGKPDGQYRNPWACNSFIYCSHNVSRSGFCKIPELVYNPYTNLCEDSSFFPCKKLDSPCAGKEDGKYSIPDVFAYLQCISNEGSYIDCSDNQVFDPKFGSCIDAKYYNMNNYCNGDEVRTYRNPLDCHSVVLCFDGMVMISPCWSHSDVYEPYANLCDPSFPCRIISTNLNINRSSQVFSTATYMASSTLALTSMQSDFVISSSVAPHPTPDSNMLHFQFPVNGTPCIKFDSEIELQFVNDNQPLMSMDFYMNQDDTLTGSCIGSPNITLTHKIPAISFTMYFNRTISDWQLNNIKVKGLYENSVSGLKDVTEKSYLTVPINISYTCTEKLRFQLEDTQNYKVAVIFKNLRLQAYLTSTSFNNDTRSCPSAPVKGKKSSIVPIVVGITLGGLMVIALVAYLVTRPRAESVYQKL